MKFAKILVLIFSVFVFGVHSIYAQTPSPNIVPGFLNPTCGLADDDKTNSCCTRIDIQKSVIAPAKIIFSVFPLPIAFIGKGILSFIGKAGDEAPFVDKFEKQCISGTAVDNVPVKNPDTGKIENKCICTSDPLKLGLKLTPSPTGGKILEICDKYLNQYKTKKEYNACVACAKDNSLMTGIGCVPTDFAAFVTQVLLKMGIGFAGIFSLGCIIYSAIMIQVSQGNAEKISQSQDQIKACIFGLLLVMFSILILRIIGINILEIPGFS